MASAYDKLVLVTRRTRLEELLDRFGTRGQARFYLEHSGGDFAAYQAEDDTYRRALDRLQTDLQLGLKVQRLDRGLLPTYLFGPGDLVVTAGQDGLVANTAKYALEQPIVAVNPDPERFDGVLLPFGVAVARRAVVSTLEGRARVRHVSLARVTLDDGQHLLAFNDLFVGARTHVSARYRLRVGDGAAETQSSSGVLISTGAGSTGWLSSVFNMARGVVMLLGEDDHAIGSLRAPSLDWEDRRLIYVVREPFRSRHSQVCLTAGVLEAGTELLIESQMGTGGVIFSDGVEADFLGFDAGRVARIGLAPEQAHLVVA
jgi:hypothetical protein